VISLPSGKSSKAVSRTRIRSADTAEAILTSFASYLTHLACSPSSLSAWKYWQLKGEDRGHCFCPRQCTLYLMLYNQQAGNRSQGILAEGNST